MQSILVYIIFVAALAYVSWKVYRSVKHKDKPGCSHCSPESLNMPKKTGAAK